MNKILSLAQTLILCSLLSCSGEKQSAPAEVSSATDSLTVSGVVSKEYLQKADSAMVQCYLTAAPFGKDGGAGAQRSLFGIGENGSFAFRVPTLCPQLCIIGIGGKSNAPAGTGDLFFLHPADSLGISVQWQDGKLTASYSGAEPLASVEDFGRAQAFFIEHINDFAGYTDMPAQQEKCLAELAALQEKRKELQLSAPIDDYLRLQLNVSALSVLALAQGVSPDDFDFLRDFDLGHDFCPSTYFFYPAMTNLIRNKAFGLPDIAESSATEWMAKAKGALGKYIPAECETLYTLLTGVAYYNQLHAGKKFSAKQTEEIRNFFSPDRQHMSLIASFLLEENEKIKE